MIAPVQLSFVGGSFIQIVKDVVAGIVPALSYTRTQYVFPIVNPVAFVDSATPFDALLFTHATETKAPHEPEKT